MSRWVSWSSSFVLLVRATWGGLVKERKEKILGDNPETTQANIHPQTRKKRLVYLFSLARGSRRRRGGYVTGTH